MRNGNPKKITDWPDLIGEDDFGDRPEPEDLGRGALGLSGGVGLRTAGAGRQSKRRPSDFVTKLYKNVPVLDSGARGSTTTFAERGIGDVLLAWENDAYLALNQFGKDKFEIVYPSSSILAEPPVALVDKNVDRHGTRAVAQAYLEYLYSPEGQALAEKHLFPPAQAAVVEMRGPSFPAIKLFTVDDVFGGLGQSPEDSFR